MEQGTNDWLMARCGKITASRFGDAIDRLKSGDLSAKSKAYLMEKVTEIISGTPTHTFVNQAMEWGTENEPLAREAYELHTLSEVTEEGFITKNNFGCSPDGLVGEDGGIEIKCPFNQINHVETLISNEVPSQYVAQVQGALWITQRKWWDFVSYDPRMPGGLDIVVIRVKPDKEYIQDMETKLEEFETMVSDYVSQLNLKLK